MAKKDVSFNIKLNVDGKDIVATATTDVKNMRNAWDDARKASRKFGEGMFFLNQISTGIQSIVQSLSVLTGAYDKQIEAETQLKNAMEQRMGATDAEINSIKQLCAAQQQLGVIGDEVQLAGAKELAMHLDNKRSIEMLLPAMNDLLVHQNGLNVSSENAASLGARLGKVLEGQTNLLTRMGFSMTAAQEAAIKYGDESAKVAAIAEVIEARVGGMNEQLAQTDAGKAKQASNAFGDMQEKVGAALSPIRTFLEKLGQFGMAAMGIAQLSKTLKGLWLMIKAATLSSGFFVKALNWIKTGSYAAAAAENTVTVATNGLKVAIRSLLISTGIGMLVVALTSLVDALFNTSDAADGVTDSLDSVNDAERELESVTSSTFGSMMSKYEELKNQWKSLKDKMSKTQFIKDHASDWEYLGLQVNSVADADAIFTKNTDAVVEAFRRRAEAAGHAAKLTKLYEEHMSLVDEITRERSGRRLDALTSVKPRKGTYVKAGEKTTYGLVEGIHYNFEPGFGERLTNEGASLIEERERALALERAGRKSMKEISLETALMRNEAQIKSEEAIVKSMAKGNTPLVVTPTTPTTSTRTGGRTASAGRTTPTKSSTPTKEELKLIANPLNEKDFENNISYWQNKLKPGMNPAEYENITKKITEVRKAYSEWLKVQIGTPSTLADYDELIQLAEQAKQTANNKEEIKALDKELETYNRLRNELLNSGIADMTDEETDTFEKLDARISYHNEQLSQADEEGRIYHQNEINRLTDLRNEWQRTLDGLKKPAGIEQLNTMDELNNAISYYQQIQARQSADEAAATQRVINQLEEKNKKLQRGIDLINETKDVNEMLSSSDSKSLVKSMGIDELTRKLTELNKVLADPEATDLQKEMAQNLIGQYSQWRKELVMSFDTLTEGWDAVKGFGSSIEELSSAFDENKNAWQTFTSIVDGIIGVIQAVSSVIQIVKILTAATTAANAVENASTKALTTSYLELAAAKIFASNASLNVFGIGKSVAEVATMMSTVMSTKAAALATGGIVSGPTLAYVGEYAGARNNPEVIAPLNKLRSMLKGPGTMDVEFRLKGKDLVGSVANTTRLSSRAGRRSNIAI